MANDHILLLQLHHNVWLKGQFLALPRYLHNSLWY